MKLDPAVVKLLNLDPEKTVVSSAGGGGCSSASTSKITTQLSDGKEKRFFMKTGKGQDAEVMFRGEHASLTAIHNAVPSLCPHSYGHGPLTSSSSSHFLVTDFLDLSSHSSKSSSLATRLAQLHITPAPIPDGYDTPMFGFPVTTCCGDTPQDNSFKSTWADFYANNRLRYILRLAEKSQGIDREVHNLVETTASVIVPRLLSPNHLNNGVPLTPVVVHGDLWSGNASGGSTYDPSACYAHSEYELGIMRMFGGFGGGFLNEYHEKCPKTEPVAEYEDRVRLYELYHHLNHYAMFGGGYRGGAVSIMQELKGKYGEG